MRRLFLRIFLAFWLAMAAVAVVLILSSPFFTRARPGVERWQRGAERVLRERLDHAVREIASGGEAGMALRRRYRHPPGEVLVVPLSKANRGSELPAEVAAFAGRVAAAGEERSEREGALHMVGRPAVTAAGEPVVVVAVARRPPGLVDLLDFRVLAWRLAVLTIAVGVLCLWLARTLTAPVTALRGAVRQLAGGDLGARAGPALARRRDEIGDLARDFDAMAERVESLVDSQRRLVRDVSHELRSPLARLQVALELARSSEEQAAADHLRRIALEAGRLEALVEQLLTLSRLEAAEGTVVREDVDLVELAEGLAADATFEGTGRTQGVTVAAATRPVIVTGDPGSLASALENVIRNAIHHAPAGTPVEVTVTGEGGVAEVRVCDRGPGVPEEHLRHIFEPFFRVEEARERERGGAGLGLAIAARAVALHRGTIVARNRAGGGLEVSIRLPLGEGTPQR